MSQLEAKYDELQDMGAEIIGISTDTHWSHEVFRKSLGLRFHLVSDYNKSISEKYVGFYNRVSDYKRVNRRAVVLIDSHMKVRWVWTTESPSEIPDTLEIWKQAQEVFHGD